MNLDTFKSQVERQGLARNTRWICDIFPPKGLTEMDNVFKVGVGPFDLSLNLPGVDLIDNAVEQINGLSLDLPGISIGNNFNIPTLGYLLRNHGGMLQCLSLYCNMVAIPQRDITNVAWREYGEERQLGIVHNHSGGLTVSYYCSEDLRERLFFEQWQDLIFNPKTKNREFYDNYIGSMEITKYDAAWKEKTAKYRFKEVYPTNIAAQTMVYEGTAVVRLDINFKYRNYERIE